MPRHHEIDTRTADIVDQAVSRLNAAGLSKPFRVASTTAVMLLKRRRRYQDRIMTVEHISDELAKIEEVFVWCAKELREAEREVGDRDPGSVVWWNHRDQLITQELRWGGDVERAVAIWRDTWREGVSMQSWQGCENLLARSDLPLDVEPSRRLMASATSALKAGDALEAYQALDALRPEAHGPAWTATLGLWCVRLLLVAETDLHRPVSEARRLIDEVETAGVADDGAAPGAERWRAVAAAALAQAIFESGDLVEADATLARFVDQPDCPADANIIAGLVAESRADFSRADELYERALEADPVTVERRMLLQPIPSRLLMAEARSDGRTLADRVRLLREAIDVGVTGPGDDPVRDANLELAETLTALGAEYESAGRINDAQHARIDSAEPYAEAGKRYTWAGLNERAAELLRKACTLAPDRPSHRWNLAETLRLQAYDANGFLDRSVAMEARHELEAGLQRGTPGPEEPWVLVTQGMVEHELDGPDRDPALTVERSLALALTPGVDGTFGDWYALGYGFLAQVLRRRGWLQEALEVSNQGVDLDPGDALIFSELVNVLIELGECEKALDRIDFQTYRRPNDEGLQSLRSMVLGRMNEPERALEELDGLELDEYVRYGRATLYESLGEREQAQAEFRAIWRERADDNDPAIVGWAAFRCDRLDEAVAMFKDAAERATNSVRPQYGLGLGQMFLAQGRVEKGRDLMLRSIAECPSPDDILEAVSYEFPVLRTMVQGSAHEDEAIAAMAAVQHAADRRVSDLRTLRRTDPVAAKAVEARIALHEERWLDAIAAYTELASSGGFREASGAIRFATSAAVRTADRLFMSGRRDDALDMWLGLQPVVNDAAETGNSDMLISLTCRVILLNVLDGNVHRDDLELMSQLLTTEATDLREAAGVLAYDIEHYWALRDGLARLADDAQLDPAAAEAALILIDGLPIDNAYAVADSLGSAARSGSLISPLRLALGAGLSEVAEGSELMLKLGELKAAISADTGVPIPWVEVAVAPELGAGDAELQLFDRPVRRATLDPASADAVDALGELAESAIRDYLFRLVGVDDVGIWLEGGDLTHSDAPAWSPTDPVAERLRLARVLRMLLREGVRVTDRVTIVSGLAGPGGGDDRRTLEALRDVRRALHLEDLGGSVPIQPTYLSEDLERRIGEGLNRHGTVWELERPAAQSLILDLRDFVSTSGDGGVRDLVVRDAPLRPFVWRLLASESPPVRVLSAEEL